MPDRFKTPVIGAAPEGATDPQAASRAVREMFTSIAPRYDLLNHVLSFNIDRLWWNRAAGSFNRILRTPTTNVLDLCCGTGDMTQALRRHSSPSVNIVGVDFSHAMLQRAQAKASKTLLRWVEADTLSIPLKSGSVDLVTAAFGFRNLADYDAGLKEIARVLKPGGECGILDFGEPKGLIGKLYRFYFRRVLPKVGTLISGVEGPYKYLPASVARFPEPEEMIERMRRAGFSETTWTPYTFGIAGLYRGKK